MNRQFALSLALAAALLSLSACAGSGILEESDTVEVLGTGATDITTATIPSASELLTPEDVEQVSGLSGLVVVPYDPSVGAGGDVNIADASGQLVAMLIVTDREVWEQWLTDGLTVAEPVTPPVGDESFIGPNPGVSPATYVFGFRKGDVAIVINTFFVADSADTVLSAEDLRALAEIVAERL